MSIEPFFFRTDFLGSCVIMLMLGRPSPLPEDPLFTVILVREISSGISDEDLVGFTGNFFHLSVHFWLIGFCDIFFFVNM